MAFNSDGTSEQLRQPTAESGSAVTIFLNALGVTSPAQSTGVAKLVGDCDRSPRHATLLKRAILLPRTFCQRKRFRDRSVSRRSRFKVSLHIAVPEHSAERQGSRAS